MKNPDPMGENDNSYLGVTGWLPPEAEGDTEAGIAVLPHGVWVLHIILLIPYMWETR